MFFCIHFSGFSKRQTGTCKSLSVIYFCCTSDLNHIEVVSLDLVHNFKAIGVLGFRNHYLRSIAHYEVGTDGRCLHMQS